MSNIYDLPYLPGIKWVLSALSSMIVLMNLFSSKKNRPQLTTLSTELCWGLSSSTNSRCILRLNQNGSRQAVIVAIDAISNNRDARPINLLFTKLDIGSVILGVRWTSALRKFPGVPLPSMVAVFYTNLWIIN